VVASGNIVVLGALQGMVHAGASGDTDAFLLALALHPTQLRIASAIALPPERPATRAVAPEIAILRDGAIIIRPYKGRLPT
jgi:septum site-determining protein MinC